MINGSGKSLFLLDKMLNIGASQLPTIPSFRNDASRMNHRGAALPADSEHWRITWVPRLIMLYYDL